MLRRLFHKSAIPSLKKIRGNKIYGIAQENDMTVQTADDIIKVVGDKSPGSEAGKWLHSPAYLSEPI